MEDDASESRVPEENSDYSSSDENVTNNVLSGSSLTHVDLQPRQQQNQISEATRLVTSDSQLTTFRFFLPSHVEENKT